MRGRVVSQLFYKRGVITGLNPAKTRVQCDWNVCSNLQSYSICIWFLLLCDLNLDYLPKKFFELFFGRFKRHIPHQDFRTVLFLRRGCFALCNHVTEKKYWRRERLNYIRLTGSSAEHLSTLYSQLLLLYGAYSNEMSFTQIFNTYDYTNLYIVFFEAYVIIVFVEN